MSKKSFSDIEAHIKQLADAHEPAFEEDAWMKMEKLLDKEDTRKRPLLFLWWLLPFVLAGGLMSYFAMQRSQKSTVPTVSGINKESQPPPNANEEVKKNVAGTPTTTYLSSGNTTVATLDVAQGLSLFEATKQTPLSFKKSTSNVRLVSNGRTSNINKNPTATGVGQIYLGAIASSANKVEKPASDNLIGNTVTSGIQNNKGTIIENKAQADTAKATQDAKKVETATVKISGRKSAMKGFYLLAGAGVEMNGLKLLPSKNVTARLGFGLGYKLNRRLSLQTGFYSSQKKYVAGEGEYTPKAGTYWSMVDIKTVEADCRVYEIPLSVRYDFKSKKKINYFSTIGLSSFLMKKEDYRYYYEHYGIPYHSGAAYTGNRHLFSVLRLAGGVEKKLNPNWSVQLSPGFSVPLAGVGEGEVKLFSTDMMLGVKFSPVVSKNK